ncbi:ABC transporter substrate-binding protein [Alteromonas sediminis]|nr:ABC transporter substrate-binding protein [Alteromonas sediminis]
MHRRIYTLLLCLALSMPTVAYGASLNVVFLNPGHPTGDKSGAFWSNVDKFMRAAASDLDIELTILHAERNHLAMKRLADEVHKYAPDYAIVVNEKGVGTDLLARIAQRNIPVFFLLNTLNQTDIAALKRHEKALIAGSLIPNNHSAGKALMGALVRTHRKKTGHVGNLNTIALLGDYTSPAALERQQGMLSYMSENSNLALIDATVANWSEREGYNKTRGLLKRERIDLIWSANDAIATGASRAVKSSGSKHKITIGGFNWDKRSEKYPIDISFGGHVTLGAKALVMLKDLHQGLLTQCERHIVMDVFKPLSTDELDAFHKNTTPNNLDTFNFERFSKTSTAYSEFDIDVFVTRHYPTAQEQPPRLSCE